MTFLGQRWLSLLMFLLGELLFIGATSSWRLNAEVSRERQAIVAGDFNASPEVAGSSPVVPAIIPRI
jgi:hypothetical protein